MKDNGCESEACIKDNCKTMQKVGRLHVNDTNKGIQTSNHVVTTTFTCKSTIDAPRCGTIFN